MTYLGSTQERESFLQEAQFLEMLKHQYILPIYDVGIDDEGFPYLVAEFASNGSLRDVIWRYHPKMVPLNETLSMLNQVGQALEYIHEQNIVHRDLKPENILFNARGEALIADFGIAVFLETTKTKYVNVIGSPMYMAPEQFEGMASRRSDQYSLACIAYELLTGLPPFVANHALAIGMKHKTEPPRPPTHVDPTIPTHVELAILKALAKDREERFPDITSFLAALNATPTGPLCKTKEQWMEEGNCLFDAQRYSDAATAFEHATRLDANFADAYEGQGSALYNIGRNKEALIAYELAIKLDPTYISAYCGKGNILCDLKQYDEALKIYQLAINLDSNFVDAHVGKGNAFYYLGRLADAIVAYEQAIRLDPQCVPAYDGKALTLRQLKRYQEALICYERSIQLDPSNPSAYAGRARTLYRLKRYEEAREKFEQAIKLAPDVSQNHEYYADVLYYLERYDESLLSYERAIKLDPQSAGAHDGKKGGLCGSSSVHKMR